MPTDQQIIDALRERESAGPLPTDATQRAFEIKRREAMRTARMIFEAEASNGHAMRPRTNRARC